MDQKTIDARIKYAGTMAPLPLFAIVILLEIMDTAKVESVLVTRTTSTPEDQARIMFNNCEKYGVEAQKQLYKAPGRAVVDVYIQQGKVGRSPVKCKALMAEKIKELGPTTISAHCELNVTQKSVFDIDPASVPAEKKQAFEIAVAQHPHVVKSLKPPVDKAYHTEVIV
jgi:hypothetical protein